ncbi:hypothetical protein H4R34_005706 [Dimargaris verticillata]|uniref:Kinase-like domain-containing protein n=1 Tax=Dimargaris verticillata TaxID=2761393 RepID=A0A9W8B1U9_9FUNG|nr:hypothetical protein H4R34_005706 [Dimargaris verticillata]
MVILCLRYPRLHHQFSARRCDARFLPLCHHFYHDRLLHGADILAPMNDILPVAVSPPRSCASQENGSPSTSSVEYSHTGEQTTPTPIPIPRTHRHSDPLVNPEQPVASPNPVSIDVPELSRRFQAFSFNRSANSPFELWYRVVENWRDAKPHIKDYLSTWKKRTPLRRRRHFTDRPTGNAQWKARRFSTLRSKLYPKTRTTRFELDLHPKDSSAIACEKVCRALRLLLPKYHDITVDQVQVIRLSGALTNSVYKIIVQRPVPPSATTQATTKTRQHLLRIYGVGVEQLFEREKELYWLRKLSELGVGPRLLAIFDNGRIEQYLESTTLTAKDIRDPRTSRHIARRMCELHSIVHTLPPRPGCVPEAWLCIDKWYPLVKQKWPLLQRKFGDRRPNLLNDLDIDALADNINKLKARVTALNPPIVFAHNDLQYGNILRLDQPSQELVVIDFEYAGYNYRGFDIANHFCEWTADYHSDTPHALDFDRYPTEEEQHMFLNAYIDEQLRLNADHYPEFQQPRPQALADLITEIACLRLATHVFWGLWGLIQASESNIDFDYLEYAHQKLSAFHREIQQCQASPPAQR